jgi:LysR family glycine cleavage system transcriptional activator
MPPLPRLPRTRPIQVGHLRTFEAVARHLNFRAAAEELALTQSAVSRQIQALEADVGAPLFLRHTRAVELTHAGAVLLRAVRPSLERIDTAVRQVRLGAGRRAVAITTWASFASMWLIPRLEAFQRAHPDIDIRIDASDAVIDLATADVDLALRYATPSSVPTGAVRLFGEQLTPVASPWLLRDTPLRSVEDLAHHALIEASDDQHAPHYEWLTWQHWFDQHAPAARSASGRPGAPGTRLVPRRWLYFNYANQMVQAALTGQGVALARLPLVAESLANGDLIEPLPHRRLELPLAYWLLVAPHAAQRPEVQAFRDWLLSEAARTRLAIGDVPDPDTLDQLD